MKRIIEGLIVDLHNRKKFAGRVEFENGVITAVVPDDTVQPSVVIQPGYIDAHVHVESSMLIPSEFARLAVVHGTVGTVSDPHEIGNVNGVAGVKYMIENGAQVPFHFAFGAPSCVPATSFETAGAEITAADIAELFADTRVKYLSEMMNWPGVLHGDPVVIEKLAIAKAHGRVIDGHAPGLKGEQAAAYASHGISTDHECFTLDEALDKLKVGMKILIREGSAARNYDALHTIIKSHPDSVMFCSDDMHPDSLVLGHINLLVKRSIELGYDEFDVLRAACLHPVQHYSLDVGTLNVGDCADFLITKTGEPWNVLSTYIAGAEVAANGETKIVSVSATVINNFECSPITVDSIDLKHENINDVVRVIVAEDGQLVTSEIHAPHTAADVLKLVVVNRYNNAIPAVAYIKGFGLQSGALASSVAHDSHNIIAVGCSDKEICNAINAVIACKGGVSVCQEDIVTTVALPVAGLMSNADGYQVARQYATVDSIAKGLGSPLRAPFMTLSFMALLVIPQLKLSDKGLFDGLKFEFTSVSI